MIIKQSDGHDEIYCEWYVCPKCGDSDIAEDHKFCPNCGIDVQFPEDDSLIKRNNPF